MININGRRAVSSGYDVPFSNLNHSFIVGPSGLDGISAISGRGFVVDVEKVMFSVDTFIKFIDPHSRPNDVLWTLNTSKHSIELRDQQGEKIVSLLSNASPFIGLRLHGGVIAAEDIYFIRNTEKDSKLALNEREDLTIQVNLCLADEVCIINIHHNILSIFIE